MGVSSRVGGAGKMEVVVPGGEEVRTVVVGVGEEGAVPTVKVGGREQKKGGEGDPDSMLEKVGRMVEDTLDRKDEEEEADRTGPEEPEEEDQPNPMKRMWEEEIVPEGVRDEL